MVATGPAPASGQQNEYANPAALVSTEWVAAHGADPGVRLVEVDVDTGAYDQGHVRGAVGWNWQTDLSDPVRRDIPSREAWEALLARSGIGNDTRVVFYGDNNNWFAAFAYWVARLYGHRDAALMNGGRKKWEAEGRELVTDAPSVAPATYRAQEPDLSLRAFRDQVLQALGAPGTALVDVRSPAEFSGEVLAPPGLPETAQRAGHIPGAVNVPWAQAANEDGTFKSRAELAALYGGKGVAGEQPVVAYCRIGERSSHTWFVLKELLGYPDVRNYDGSWTEWGSVIGAPIDNPSATS
ncbi:MAG TPA: sulfurtransferase [Chloroflexota bacterium]|nr:sulfurtransferase [Chloroflexota bacterium]